jgi:hypothetical protein
MTRPLDLVSQQDPACPHARQDSTRWGLDGVFATPDVARTPTRREKRPTALNVLAELAETLFLHQHEQRQEQRRQRRTLDHEERLWLRRLISDARRQVAPPPRLAARHDRDR